MDSTPKTAHVHVRSVLTGEYVDVPINDDGYVDDPSWPFLYKRIKLTKRRPNGETYEVDAWDCIPRQ